MVNGARLATFLIRGASKALETILADVVCPGKVRGFHALARAVIASCARRALITRHQAWVGAVVTICSDWAWESIWVASLKLAVEAFGTGRESYGANRVVRAEAVVSFWALSTFT